MTEVARLYVGIYSDSKDLQTGLRDAERQVNAADDRMTRTSSRMSGAMKAGFAAGGAAALEFGRRAFNSAVQFESSMANVQAVTGATSEEIAALSTEVRNIGAGSVPGVQATASAFFDISSAVADADARMTLLRQSVALAEAGQADMAVTSGALVKAFNAYGFAAGDAEFISDVYTRTVQTGIGTMDQFAAAISSNAGIAANAKIDFEELGAAMAFITSKGQTTGAAGTQIKAVISSLLKPSQDLQRVYDELGISSITTAIETDGFIETLQRLTAEAGGSEAELAAMFGSVEALQGAMVLGGDDADDFFDSYTQGLDGATAAARDAQLDTFSAQWAMLKSNIEGAGIAAMESGGVLEGVTATLKVVNTIFDDPTAGMDASSAAMARMPDFFIDIDTGEIENSMAAFREYDRLLAEETKRIEDTAFGQSKKLEVALAAVIGSLTMPLEDLTGIDFAEPMEIFKTIDMLDFEMGIDMVMNPIDEFTGSVSTTLAGLDFEMAVDLVTNPIDEFTGGISQSLDMMDFSIVTDLRLEEGAVMNLIELVGVPDIPLHLGLQEGTVANLIELIGVPGIPLRLGLLEGTVANFVSLIGNPTAAMALGLKEGAVSALLNLIGTPTIDVILSPINAASSVMGDIVGGAESLIPGRASGGPVSAGSPYIVGEEGMELFVPGSNGTIVPNSAMGGGSSQTIVTQIVMDGQVVAETVNRVNRDNMR